MLATPERTERYHARHTGIHTSVLGRTGLRVSGAGFGGYRVSAGIAAHRMALRRALVSGINLIDTSANYADGGSEELIGEVIAELEADGLLSRGEIVLVSKGGYIQGSNYEMARERAESGSGFPDVVEYGPGLWHCIAPEFLHDQISRSLDRLGLPAIDVYLLHNPEYYLNWAAKAGIDRATARAEYLRRIRDAFAFLETEVESGRIGCYGISSNSFPASSADADFTSLEECIRIAERISLLHNFKVIQFPANLVERGFVAEPNQSEGRTLIGLAREKNLGVLINRPLNAIVGGELIRLADFPAAETPLGDEHITAGIDRLIGLEKEFRMRHLPSFADDREGSAALAEFIAVGATMREHWKSFGSIEHYNDILAQHFAPRLAYASEYLREHGTRQHVDWYAGYMADARALLQVVAVYYGRDAQRRAMRIREKIAPALGEEPQGSLSSIALRLLLGVEGVDTVLLGMRREEYVDDCIGALRAGPLGNEEFWKTFDLSGIIAEEEG